MSAQTYATLPLHLFYCKFVNIIPVSGIISGSGPRARRQVLDLAVAPNTMSVGNCKSIKQKEYVNYPHQPTQLAIYLEELSMPPQFLLVIIPSHWSVFRGPDEGQDRLLWTLEVLSSLYIKPMTKGSRLASE